MNKQIAMIGRKLSAADMKKTIGGGGGVGTGGTGGFRCAAPPPPPKCINTYVSNDSLNCCRCCAGASGCEIDRSNDPNCWFV
jgi:hypothetical protein